MPDYAINTQFNARDRLSQAFNKMGNKSRDFGNRANRAFNKASASGSRFGDIIKGILGAQLLRRGFQLLKEGLGNFITQASLIEDATANFTPLMGSVEKATELVDALNQEAASTPFQFEGISKIASQLLPVMNGSIEDTIDTFRLLGDTAGGNMEKLTSITRGFTKAMLLGKPDMESLKMIAEAGVPIFTEMAKSMGITTDQLFEMSRAGLITNADLTKTFQDMTSEGGLFFRGMEIASLTLTGKLSTLKDNINLAFGAIGTVALPIIKSFVDTGIEAAQSIVAWAKANEKLIQSGLEQFILVVTGIFETLGPPIDNIIKAIQKVGSVILDIIGTVLSPFIDTNKTMKEGFEEFAGVLDIVAGVIDAFAEGIRFLKPLIVPLVTVLGIWTIAQWALNAAMTANPIGLIVVGIAAFIALIGILVTNWDAIVKAIGDGINDIWNWFSGLLDNPFFVAIGVIFLPFITIPALIRKHWEPIKQFFLDIWNKILVPFGIWIGEIFGGAFTAVADAVIVAWNKVGEVFQWIWDNVISPIVGFISDAIGTVDEFFSGFGPNLEVRNFLEQKKLEQENAETAPNETAPNKQEAEAKTFSFLGRLDIFGAPDGSTVSQDEKSTPGIDLNLLGVNP